METKYPVPADVPDELIETFIDNMDAATCGTGKMNLFACDQKIEHLNDDFYDGGNKIPLHQMTLLIFSKLEQGLTKKEQSVYWLAN